MIRQVGSKYHKKIDELKEDLQQMGEFDELTKIEESMRRFEMEMDLGTNQLDNALDKIR